MQFLLSILHWHIGTNLLY